MSNRPDKLGSTATAYRVMTAALKGDPNAGPRAYGDWKDTGLLLPVHVEEHLAPRCLRARMELDLAFAEVHAWRWREKLSSDDRVLIISEHPQAADRHIPFVGWIAEVDWGAGQTGEQCLITAVGPAYRLLRDAAAIVRGRYMWPAQPGQAVPVHVTGLPCEFNAGGRPNRHRLRDADTPGAWAGGLGVFTHEGDPAAEWWSVADAIDYILRHHNAAEDWLYNPPAPEDLSPLEGRVFAGCEGRSAWQAVAELADLAACDVAERITNNAKGEPNADIVLVKRGEGTRRVLRHQAPDDGGAMPALELAATDAITISVAESVADCCTRPIVVGGRAIHEIGVTLYPAWRPADLTRPADSRIVPPGMEDLYANELYCRRYCTDGDLHHLYADAGRLWDANTDGRYAEPPYSQPVQIIPTTLGGWWPRMPHAARDVLTRLLTGDAAPGAAASVGMYLDWTVDGRTVQRVTEPWEIVPGRLAVRLTARNPASYWRSLTDPNQNLFKALVDGGAPALRLTCSVASPCRAVAFPARRASAGTRFETGALYDRGLLGQTRSRAIGIMAGVFIGSGAPADTCEDDGELARQAAMIQAAGEDRQIEISVGMEWPDELPRLTDVVTEIEGLSYELGTNLGTARRYPRIVARTLLLGPETYAMQIVLGSERKGFIR